MMVFCNNFAVTIGNNPLFSGILKKTINSTSFLALFQNFVTENNSQRIELLFREKDGLFFRTCVNASKRSFVHEASKWFCGKVRKFLQNISRIVLSFVQRRKKRRNIREKTSFCSFRAFDGLVEMEKCRSFRKATRITRNRLGKSSIRAFRKTCRVCGLSICGAPFVVFDSLFLAFALNQFNGHFFRYRFALFL